VQQVGDALEPNCSAALIVWENTWAERFVTAMRRADARVVDQVRIPAETVSRALESVKPQAV